MEYQKSEEIIKISGARVGSKIILKKKKKILRNRLNILVLQANREWKKKMKIFFAFGGSNQLICKLIPQHGIFYPAIKVIKWIDIKKM